MRRILLSLFVLFTAIAASAQITVYEYKSDDNKAYATFEFDTPLIPDSTSVRGLYRAYEYLNVHYYDMVFHALAHKTSDGSIIIRIKPNFYNHANIIKLAGERENLNEKDCIFTFKLEGDSITNITPDAIKKKIQYKSSYSQKKYIDITDFPTFKRGHTMDWKRIPDKLARNLHGKDRTFNRGY